MAQKELTWPNVQMAAQMLRSPSAVTQRATRRSDDSKKIRGLSKYSEGLSDARKEVSKVLGGSQLGAQRIPISTQRFLKLSEQGVEDNFVRYRYFMPIKTGVFFNIDSNRNYFFSEMGEKVSTNC